MIHSLLGYGGPLSRPEVYCSFRQRSDDPWQSRTWGVVETRERLKALCPQWEGFVQRVWRWWRAAGDSGPLAAPQAVADAVRVVFGTDTIPTADPKAFAFRFARVSGWPELNARQRGIPCPTPMTPC